MENSVKDIIRRRKSVRTFNGKALRKEDRQKLEHGCRIFASDPYAGFDSGIRENDFFRGITVCLIREAKGKGKGVMPFLFCNAYAGAALRGKMFFAVKRPWNACMKKGSMMRRGYRSF